MKISKNNIFAADQDNSLYLIDKKNGERIKNIPTEEVTLKNDFFKNIMVLICYSYFKKNKISINSFNL